MTKTCEGDKQKQLEMKRAQKREAKARSRAKQTKAQREEENAKARVRMAKKWKHTSEEVKAAKRAKARENIAKRRQNMTEEQREEAKRRDRERKAKKRKRDAETRKGLIIDPDAVMKGMDTATQGKDAGFSGTKNYCEMKMAAAMTGSTLNSKGGDIARIAHMEAKALADMSFKSSSNAAEETVPIATAVVRTQHSASVGVTRSANNEAAAFKVMVNALFTEANDPVLNHFCSMFSED